MPGGYADVVFPRAARALAVAAITLGACGSAAALPGPLTSSAAVSLSSSAAGARPVSLTLTLSYEMQCGYPGPGPVVIDLPAQERVPAALSPLRVLVDGHPAQTVAISGHKVTVGLAAPPQVTCMVIGMGRLTILFTRTAGLGNPARAGSYTVAATRASSQFAARFTIRPA